MNNFSFVNPVKIIFGKDTIKDLTKEIPADSKVLIIYGGGSIKSNGVYDQVTKALTSFEWFEYSGIEANPHYETCMEVVSYIKENNIDYLLAVGGGSVVDATKFIAAAACFEGNDPWDILSKHAKIKAAIPFGVVLTLSATGSEMNAGAVITKSATQDKLAFGSPHVYPKFSILDPEVTYSLPPRQVSNGIADAFVHVIEQYLTYPLRAMIQDKFAEAILTTLTIEGPKALATPNDYDVRANLMWASTWALNGWIGCGVPEDWATHQIGHELTALYGLDHAQTLAIVLPGVMTILKEQKAEKILQLGQEVFGIYNNLSREERIENTIKAVENFFEEIHIKTHLSDYGLNKDSIDKVCSKLQGRGWTLGEKSNITPDIVREILTCRL
ncbi:NADP-dependent alcohol dehydrogenase [Dysgonomonas alginatilytica]|uniref:NADP-dependent alcohol dehydrogenase n=1 Tax=Dysgonomonas alginatilytica TaxID=1605892 RepID=A0A2V3PUM3_9BACT|nr:iron-containing alcohol dehydrogenase [Dysgonomonas alginatilytica]PXV63142.1 NADP-dependent alcohol dehydrogenase [Dysgonomonas alginatilytica]